MNWHIRAPLPKGEVLHIGEMSHHAMNQLLQEGIIGEDVLEGKIIYTVIKSAAYTSPFGHCKVYLLEGYYLIGEQ